MVCQPVTPYCRFFSVTPERLVRNGLYKDLAIALMDGRHRDVSMALLAQKLGGKQQRGLVGRIGISTASSRLKNSTSQACAELSSRLKSSTSRASVDGSEGTPSGGPLRRHATIRAVTDFPRCCVARNHA